MIYLGKILMPDPFTNSFPEKTPLQTARLVAELAEVAARHPLREKWLLCPNRRIGQQWLDRIALSGRPAVNFRLCTPISFALMLVDPRLRTDARTLITPLGRVVIAAQLLADLAAADAKYLGRLQPSVALAERLAATIRDVRLAGLTPQDLERGSFEVRQKGRE
ncbi:MAG: hypothetical protein N3B01_04170, partial [Verrucomicrobiae bacterium]|nr:hypothetical protein [Verrucomicrobiae bacterium]